MVGYFYLERLINPRKNQITKMAWETKGVRSVKNAITIRGENNLKAPQKIF